MSRRQLVIHIAASAAVIAVLFFGTIIAFSLYASNRTEETCLANKLDRYWTGTVEDNTKRRWFFWRRNQDARTAKAQAEAMARIFIKQAERNKESLCPPDWWRWGWHSMWRELVGARVESERWKYLYAVSQSARRRTYSQPWPQKYECAQDFKASFWSPSPRFSARSGERKLRIIGRIGSMTLYCEQ